MNDRGLSLSPTDMLKGYLLANIDEANRTAANTRWRDRVRELNDAGKEVESDCFKAWLHAATRHQDPRAQEGREARGLRPHRH